MAEHRADEMDVNPRVSSSRRIRRVVATILVVAFSLGYIAVIVSYRTGFDQTFSPPTPPKGGVAVVFAPTRVDPDARSTSGDLLLFLSPELTDSSGKSMVPLRLELFPALSQNSVDYAQGQIPSPVAVTVPTPGIVQQYPLDTYQVGFSVRTSANAGIGPGTEVPTQSSMFFEVPGWNIGGVQAERDSASEVTTTALISRSGSTKMVAALMLVLMVVLAAIAVLVVQSSATGRMRLELNVASWITAMLFALLPIRGFLPGDPPIGSWIDILVFFWVEATIMVCVALAAIGLLMRAREQRLSSKVVKPSK